MMKTCYAARQQTLKKLTLTLSSHREVVDTGKLQPTMSMKSSKVWYYMRHAQTR